MHNPQVKKATIGAGVTALVVASFFLGLSIGTKPTTDAEKITGILNMEASKPNGVDFAAFWKAWNVLNEKFAAKGTTTPVKDEDKVWGAIQGLTASFGDPYTVFFPPKENQSFHEEISGKFEGVGMEVGIDGGSLTVIAPLKGTPAERAGIVPGDKITKIDGKSTIDMSVDSAIKLIRGKGGTAVKLTVVHKNSPTEVDISVVRETINIPTVETETKQVKDGKITKSETGLRDDGIFVLKLYSFTDQSANLFRNALREFVLSGSHKLIIDLRGNPGGYLDAAVDMASWFLPSGKVIVKEDFGGKQEEKVYRSHGYDIFNDSLKLIILVNRGSASASEILAGALKEQGKATLVGDRTFGKGSVQELVDITDKTALKVTVARWLTPNGNSISNGGLKPDVDVQITEDDVKNKRDPQMDKAVELLTAQK